MASEASYVYILSGQKFIKNAQNSLSWRVLESLKLLIGQKLVENAKIEMRHFEYFCDCHS